MRRMVVGLFKSLHQAERALSEIETAGYANNQISLIVKADPRFLAAADLNTEYAGEVTGDPAIGVLHDFDSFLVQADNIDLPGIGLVTAGGPLAGALVQGDKTLAEALSYYGVEAERAFEIENRVHDGYILAAIETNHTKSSEVANLLDGYGAHGVEKWSPGMSKPFRPWNGS